MNKNDIEAQKYAIKHEENIAIDTFRSLAKHFKSQGEKLQLYPLQLHIGTHVETPDDEPDEFTFEVKNLSDIMESGESIPDLSKDNDLVVVPSSKNGYVVIAGTIFNGLVNLMYILDEKNDKLGYAVRHYTDDASLPEDMFNLAMAKLNEQLNSQNGEAS